MKRALLLLCLLGCSASQKRAEQRFELQLDRDCHDVEAVGLDPAWVRLSCDIVDTAVILTVPSSAWHQANGIIITEAGGP